MALCGTALDILFPESSSWHFLERIIIWSGNIYGRGGRTRTCRTSQLSTTRAGVGRLKASQWVASPNFTDVNVQFMTQIDEGWNFTWFHSLFCWCPISLLSCINKVFVHPRLRIVYMLPLDYNFITRKLKSIIMPDLLWE